jgi:hypothetical protein
MSRISAFSAIRRATLLTSPQRRTPRVNTLTLCRGDPRRKEPHREDRAVRPRTLDDRPRTLG